MILWRYPLHTLGRWLTTYGYRLDAYGFIIKFGMSGLLITWVRRTPVEP